MAGRPEASDEAGRLQEEAFVRAFVVPRKRERWLGFLRSPRRRATIRRALAHTRDLDPRYARRLSGNTSEILRDRGAPDMCHLISESTDLDGADLPLETALGAIDGSGVATVLCCVPGRLAFYEGEGPDERFLLERPEEARPS